MLRSKRCERSFFDRAHLEVARDLLCCELVWDDVTGIIVETESYGNADDPACHTATRPSTREFIRRNPPGTVYAYINYGMYWLLNVLAADGITRAILPKHHHQRHEYQNRKSVSGISAADCPAPISRPMPEGMRQTSSRKQSRRDCGTCRKRA
jgi:3-methyladenine DNA glycosylase Mpg